MRWDDANARMEAAQELAPAMVRALMAGGAEPHDAEDAVSAAVLAARRCRARTPAQLRSFLNTCAHNALVDRYRTALPVAVQAVLVADERLVPEDPTAIYVDAAAVRQEVDALPARQREAVYLVSDGASVEEVAAAQGTTYKAAERIIARARATVRERINTTCGGIAALLRPRPARRAVLALPAVLLGAVALLVLRLPVESLRPVPPDPALPTLAADGRPRLTPTPPAPSVADVLAPSAGLPSATPPPSVRAAQTTKPPDARDVAASVTPPVTRDREPGPASLPEEVVYCVEHLTVPPHPEVCPSHGPTATPS